MDKYEFSSTCWSLEEAKDTCKDVFDKVEANPEDDSVDTWPVMDCANQIMEAFNKALQFDLNSSKEVSCSAEPIVRSDKRYDVIDVKSGTTVLSNATNTVVHVLIDNYDQPLEIRIHTDNEARTVGSYSRNK